MNLDQEAIDDLMRIITRIADTFNYDVTKREDPDDAEETWAWHYGKDTVSDHDLAAQAFGVSAGLGGGGGPFETIEIKQVR